MLAYFCKECGTKMKHVMRYDPSGGFIFYKCPKCYFETKPKKIVYEERQIDKEENRKIIRKGNNFRYER